MDPLAEYISRRDRWRAEQQSAQKRFIRLGNWRLGVAGIAIAMAFLSIGRMMFSAWWLAIPAAVFATLVVLHARVVRRRTFAERGVRFYTRGVARLQNEWMGQGDTGERFLDPVHLYSGDLDVFGKGSLFELLATARTASGEETLANWLRSVSGREEAIARQQAAGELAGRLDLREGVALLGEDVRAEVQEKGLGAWGSGAPVYFAPYLRAIAPVLAVGAVVTLFAFFARVLPVAPFAAILAANVTIGFVLRRRVRQVVEGVDTPGHDLRIFALLLARVEREQFEAAKLRELHRALQVEGLPASRRIAGLERWVDILDSTNVPLIRAIQPALLWREQAAMAIEAWRRKNGRHVAGWVRAIAEFEALSAFASLKYERPEWTFPTLVDGPARFEAQSLLHPLMARDKCVPNDVSIGGEARLLIVSGSNMSGKSTLLRSVGLNTILAWAGGPVAARAVTVSTLHTGASVRVVDSLQDNRSRFFAEITRIREIVELARREQVLFLLDELLSGTNSRDRRIGASAIARELISAGAIGLITTHDLALAEIEQDLQQELGRAAANVHFEDRIQDGRIEFDYRLKAGVVTHSNALELMRTIGLTV
ncbi:MAG: mismatch repair protein [Acidobacteriaceae bacterium]|nr:mismatch repair protein [Acidobacteriaceae bacterium]